MEIVCTLMFSTKLRTILIFLLLCRMVRDGYFGFKGFFKSLCDGVESANDFYLGSDFQSYLEAQVIFIFS